MQPGMTAKIAAANADPLAPVGPPSLGRWRNRRAVTLILAGLLAYLAGMVALIPARMIVDENENFKVGGTIWNGEAVFASTMRAEWQFAPLTSLTHMGFAADWRLSGGGTDLAGSLIKRGAAMRFEQVSGQADAHLLSVLAPNLPINCSFVADVRIKVLQLGGGQQGGEGSVRMSPSRCSAKAIPGPVVDVPALSGTVTPSARGTSGSLMTLAAKQNLVELRLTRDGALSIWPTAMAVRMAPVLAGQRYDKQIE